MDAQVMAEEPLSQVVAEEHLGTVIVEGRDLDLVCFTWRDAADPTFEVFDGIWRLTAKKSFDDRPTTEQMRALLVQHGLIVPVEDVEFDIRMAATLDVTYPGGWRVVDDHASAQALVSSGITPMLRNAEPWPVAYLVCKRDPTEWGGWNQTERIGGFTSPKGAQKAKAQAQEAKVHGRTPDVWIEPVALQD